MRDLDFSPSMEPIDGGNASDQPGSRKTPEHTHAKWIMVVLLAITALVHCKKPGDEDQAHGTRRKSGVSDFRHLDYENLDHLVRMHREASLEDVEFARQSLLLAEKQKRNDGHLFPRVALEEALKSYPTPEVVLEFANGFLRVAQHHVPRETVSIRTPLGDNDIQWYLDGAIFFLNLATEFSERIRQPFTAEVREKIAWTSACLRKALAKEATDHSSLALCGAVDVETPLED